MKSVVRLTVLAFSTLRFVVPAFCDESTDRVFIELNKASDLVHAKPIIVLDARGHDARAPYLPGAQVVDWTSYRAGLWKTGLLEHDVSKIATAFEKLGVSNQQPVLVYGSMAKGFGEEGRIWWTLRYLGIESVYILNGGIEAWTQAGYPTRKQASKTQQQKGKIRLHLQKSLRQQWPSVNQARLRGDVQIVDVRSKAEFLGETPYGSTRGGHIPEAHHLPWKTLISPSGRIATKTRFEKQLRAAGLSKDRPVITYCTGGVRSAFVMAILVHQGWREISNYDGSWWEWSRLRALPVRTKTR